jgi:hypothetical protein
MTSCGSREPWINRKAGTATRWLSFGEFNGLLVYYTHLMPYRCAIREARFGVDTAVPDRVLKNAALRHQGPQRHSP